MENNTVTFEAVEIEHLRQVLEGIFDAQSEAAGIEKIEDETIAIAAIYQGKIAGGLIAKQTYESIYINLLAVDEAYREQRIGSQLMQKIEEIAIQRGMIHVTLTTKSYQALDFYQKNGYVVFGSLADMPMRGVTKYYLHKRLKA